MNSSNKPFIKIAFIGNSRAGKSSLINIFSSKLIGHSVSAFITSRGKD
jgi:GTP-binding protein EngB required for normal cell division